MDQINQKLKNLLLSYIMYNLFTKKKEWKLNNKLEKIKKDFVEIEENRRKLNDSLSHSYKKRIEGFIISMIDKPIEIKQFREFKYQPRDNLPSKISGNSTMYFKGFKKQKDRIENSMRNNQILDDIPFHNISQHKFRQTNNQIIKKIHPQEMHFKSKNTLQKITDSLMKIRHNQLSLDQSFRKTKKLNEQKNSSQKILDNNKKYRNILPDLHQKTHFKALVTMYNEYPNGCLNSKQNFVKNQYEDEDQNQEITQKQDSLNLTLRKKKEKEKKSQGIENFDPKETSKEALAKCNLIKSKNSSVPVLRSGQGKQIHSDSLTIKSLYNTLYGDRVNLHFMRN